MIALELSNYGALDFMDTDHRCSGSGLSFIAFYLRAVRPVLLVLFVGITGFTSSQAHRFIVKTGASQRPMNQAVVTPLREGRVWGSF